MFTCCSRQRFPLQGHREFLMIGKTPGLLRHDVPLRCGLGVSVGEQVGVMRQFSKKFRKMTFGE